MGVNPLLAGLGQAREEQLQQQQIGLAATSQAHQIAQDALNYALQAQGQQYAMSPTNPQNVEAMARAGLTGAQATAAQQMLPGQIAAQQAALESERAGTAKTQQETAMAPQTAWRQFVGQALANWYPAAVIGPLGQALGAVPPGINIQQTQPPQAQQAQPQDMGVTTPGIGIGTGAPPDVGVTTPGIGVGTGEAPQQPQQQDGGFASPYGAPPPGIPPELWFGTGPKGEATKGWYGARTSMDVARGAYYDARTQYLPTATAQAQQRIDNQLNLGQQRIAIQSLREKSLEQARAAREWYQKNQIQIQRGRLDNQNRAQMATLGKSLMNSNDQLTGQISKLTSNAASLMEQSNKANRYINDIAMKAEQASKTPDEYVALLNNPQVQKEYLDMVATAGATKQSIAAITAQKQEIVQQQLSNLSLAKQLGVKVTLPSGKTSPTQTNALGTPGPPTITNKADYDALPAGRTYIDGRTGKSKVKGQR